MVRPNCKDQGGACAPPFSLLRGGGTTCSVAAVGYPAEDLILHRKFFHGGPQEL